MEQLPQGGVNDFVIKFANVNGSGSASANGLLMKAIFRMGVPVSTKNFFPPTSRGSPPGSRFVSAVTVIRRAVGRLMSWWQ